MNLEGLGVYNFAECFEYCVSKKFRDREKKNSETKANNLKKLHELSI